MPQCVPRLPSPLFQHEDFITLTSGGDTITLPNPEFNNVQTIAAQRADNRNIAGDLYLYNFAKFDFINQYKIKKATDEEIDEYLTFCEDHIGDVITITDYNGHSWSAILTNFGNVERETECSNSIVLEFIAVEHGT